MKNVVTECGVTNNSKYINFLVRSFLKLQCRWQSGLPKDIR